MMHPAAPSFPEEYMYLTVALPAMYQPTSPGHTRRSVTLLSTKSGIVLDSGAYLTALKLASASRILLLDIQTPCLS